MKKWFVTSFCAATLFATQFTTADAANVNEEVKSDPTFRNAEVMNWGNYQGFVYQAIEKLGLQQNGEFDQDNFEVLVNKTLNELNAYKEIQQGQVVYENNAAYDKTQGETAANESANQAAEKEVVPKKAAPSANAAPVTNNNTAAPVDQSISEFEKQVVVLTNVERQKAGLAPLEISTPLMAVAEDKSEDMAKNNYFSHTSPTYGSPFDQIQAAGIDYRAAGENIAQGQKSPEEVVQAWMNSEGHRANILNANYTHIGVGYVEDGNYWTQQFIQL